MDTNKTLVLALTILFVLLSFLVFSMGDSLKIITISMVSFVSMAFTLLVNNKVQNIIDNHPSVFIWVYGLSSGSMIMSASIFLLPVSVSNSVIHGSIGIGLGIVIGYLTHTVSHNQSHNLEDYLKDKKELINLILHTVFAGSIIGLIYSQVPSISIILGLAIISHKFPASLAVVSRLNQNSTKEYLVIIPAALFGIFAYLTYIITPNLSPIIISLIFGLGVGVFLHLAMDVIPECEHGHIRDFIEGHCKGHQALDRMRHHSMLSVVSGSILILLLWYIIV